MIGHQLAGMGGIPGLHLDSGVLDREALAQLDRGQDGGVEERACRERGLVAQGLLGMVVRVLMRMHGFQLWRGRRHRGKSAAVTNA